MPIPTFEGLDLAGAIVLVRSDLNVPLLDGEVADDFRIRVALPTIRELRSRGARVVVASHLGRPRGFDPALSMTPVTARLGELGGFTAIQAPAPVGPDARSTIEAAPASAVVVLENTRFAAGETTNEPDTAAGFAALADVFVNDAFGTAQRSHASTVGVAAFLPSAAGLLFRSEIDAFSRLLTEPERPYVVVLGGAKVSDKLGAIRALLPLVDLMLIGGAMCFTLLAAGGYRVGDSLVDEKMIDEVGELLDGPHGAKLVLPPDIVVADRFAADAPGVTVPGTAIPGKQTGLDVGPKTVSRFGAVIEQAQSVFWNGPMGVFEWEAFRFGTAGIADAVARSEGYTVVGGGDSIAALRLLGRDGDVSHLSSGGGAGLSMLEGRALPAVTALENGS